MKTAVKVVMLALGCFSMGAAAKTLWHQLDDYTFENYITEFGKQYETAEEHATRQAIFQQRLTEIQRHNRDASKTWKEGVNHLTDRTPAEFGHLLGYNKRLGYSMHQASPNPNPNPPPAKADYPSSVDWRAQGVVSAVKDQGDCGSCWTFATMETLESHYAIKTGQLPVLSEQQILDCIPNPKHCGGTGGCGGGTAEIAYIGLNATGAASEWTYPYVSYYGTAQACMFGPRTPPAVQVKGYVKLPTNIYAPVIAAIATLGPLAISVEANHWSAYESGVFDGCNQTNPDVDHVVELVGYGTDAATASDYWLVRNSWSPAWGEAGYIRLRRTADESNRCGTDLVPGDGSGCDGGPPTIQVCGTCGILFDNCYPIV